MPFDGNIRDILIGARARIEQGWCQHYETSPDGKEVCAVTAVLVVAQPESVGPPGSIERCGARKTPVLEQLFIRLHGVAQRQGFLGADEMNNAPGMTKGRILGLFDTTIAECPESND